jgi:hypothetical protein
VGVNGNGTNYKVKQGEGFTIFGYQSVLLDLPQPNLILHRDGYKWVLNLFEVHYADSVEIKQRGVYSHFSSSGDVRVSSGS